MAARVVFAGTPADGATYQATRDPALAVAFSLVVVAAAIILTACPRRSITVVGLLAAGFAAASNAGMHNYLAIPLLFALFAALAWGTVTQTCSCLALIVIAMATSSVLAAPDHVASELAGQLSTAAVTAGVAVGVRAVTGWRLAAAKARADQEQLTQLGRERDEALSRSRVAAELHDSVGHNLTAIIALSEGLTNVTGDDDLDRALASINNLARDGLDQTRHAVTALTAPATNNTGTDGERHWDRIPTVAATLRATGTPITITETGTRPTDPAIAELAFTIIREALTNALRHSTILEHASIAIDHTPHATTLSIHNTDTASPLPPAVGGTGAGLQRLAGLVTRQGGTFTAGPGPTPGTWQVHATLPHTLTCGSTR